MEASNHQEQKGDLQPGWLKKGDGLSRAQERRIEIELEIDRSTNELWEWYALLIRASNCEATQRRALPLSILLG